MFKFKPSIRNKVKYGYYIALALIVVVALLSYLNLERIERKIALSLIISDFFDATLEMRRFEKNFILYKDKNDYSENLRFTEKAEDIIESSREAIKKLSIKTDVYALEKDIHEYKSLMKRYFQMDKTLNPVEAYTLEGKIREKGKKIVTATEHISTIEKGYIKSLIVSSNRILLASIVFLVIVGCILGQYLSHMVVQPLKQLENGMQRIADGRFDTCNILSTESKDREILSLSNACHRMIKELELRQVRLISQSDKLASLGTMVSGVAHQLNNPLSNISTSSQILLEEIEESSKETIKEILLQIEGEVERAKTMVRSLLDFSKKKEFKSEPLPFNDLVEETIKLIKGEIPTRVEVKVDIPEDIWIIADKQKLQQAILNLIKNSIDAIPDEGKVSVTAKENSETNTIEIKIYDTGLGIEAENIETIFEPFFTTKDRGTGLGLFVAREIIKEHGGIIEVDSTVGQGTSFTIKLPAKEL